MKVARQSNTISRASFIKQTCIPLTLFTPFLRLPAPEIITSHFIPPREPLSFPHPRPLTFTSPPPYGSLRVTACTLPASWKKKEEKTSLRVIECRLGQALVPGVPAGKYARIGFLCPHLTRRNRLESRKLCLSFSRRFGGGVEVPDFSVLRKEAHGGGRPHCPRGQEKVGRINKVLVPHFGLRRCETLSALHLSWWTRMLKFKETNPVVTKQDQT